MPVGQAHLVTLIDKGCTFHSQGERGQEHGRLFTPLRAVITKARNDTRIVVVAEKKGRPAMAIQSLILTGKYRLEFRQSPRLPAAIRAAIDLDGGELEDHVQFLAALIYQFRRVLQGHAKSLADRHNIILRQDFAVHFMQIVVHVWAVGIDILRFGAEDFRQIGEGFVL